MPTMIAAIELSHALFIAGLAIVITVFLRQAARFSSRQKRSDAAIVRTQHPPVDFPSSDAPNDFTRFEVRAHDVARDFSGQLDSKMGVLEQLIREADRAAARLEKAILDAARDDLSEPAARHVDDRLPDQAQGLKAAASSIPASGSARNARHEEIYTLSDYGLRAAEIAQRVGTPIGEVELILGLRDKG